MIPQILQILFDSAAVGSDSAMCNVAYIRKTCHDYKENVHLEEIDQSTIDLWWTWPRHRDWDIGKFPDGTSWWWTSFDVRFRF